jgi:ABC-type dipeptide/oligopeptide/nickel transport system permease subunit
MADKSKRVKHSILSMQPDIENLFELTPEDFEPVTAEQKDGFIPDRESVSYGKYAWRRLKRNFVSMAALGVILFLVLFAFVGPAVVPYGYDQFNEGAENLYPWHYTLADQQKLEEEMGSFDERLETALAKAEEEKGAALDSIETAQIKAQVSAQAYGDTQLRKQLGIKKHLFGYSISELTRKNNGEKVFPHIFGTDKYGRDILVRVMMGTRVSMLVGIIASIIVLIIGALYGAISGYAGGAVDSVMMRIVELIYAIPEMLVVLLLATALKEPLTSFQNSGTGVFQSLVRVAGPNLICIFLCFALLYWVTMARIVRGQVLQLKKQEYIVAAKALGAKRGRIIRKHLLPNCIGQIVVTACLQIPSAIFLESFMSYLGVGVTAPLTSLGSMAAEALGGVDTYAYRLVIPAIILSLLILAFNLLGDGLRDALDPRLKK